MGLSRLFKEIQLEAMANVLVEDFADEAYYLRRLSRWYSKTFSTPLHLVESLPVYVILRAYFEEKFEGLKDADKDEELDKLRMDLLETDEARKARERLADGEDVEDESFHLQAEEEERLRLLRAREQGLAVSVPDRPGLEIQGRTQAPQKLTPWTRETTMLGQGAADPMPPYKVEFGTMFDDEDQG